MAALSAGEQSVQQPEQQSCYPLDTVVWASVDGFAPWPARVISRSQISEHQRRLVKKKMRKNEALVMFFNDNNRFCVVEDSKLQLFCQGTFDETIKRNKASRRYRNILREAAKSAEAFIDVHKPPLNLNPPEKKKENEQMSTPATSRGRPRGSTKNVARKRSNSRGIKDEKKDHIKIKEPSILSVYEHHDTSNHHETPAVTELKNTLAPPRKRIRRTQPHSAAAPPEVINVDAVTTSEQPVEVRTHSSSEQVNVDIMDNSERHSGLRAPQTPAMFLERCDQNVGNSERHSAEVSTRNRPDEESQPHAKHTLTLKCTFQ